MTKAIQNEYHPDSVSPPGETLEEELETRGMTPSELANQMDYPLNTITEIIVGRGEITPEIAARLEQVLGISASFWNNYERGYRESLARRTDPVAFAA
jgi:HTH-type transcriptional regulator / antitoxin HigA